MASFGRRFRAGIGIGLGLTLCTASICRALVTTKDIENGAVTTPKIAARAVTAAKLDTNAVTNTKIVNGAISAAKIAAGAVTADKVRFYGNVVIVARSGGDFTSPVAAMASITDASASKRYLVQIMPGVYNIGNDTVQMKPYVDIEGSGADATLITGSVSIAHTAGSLLPLYGVVTGSARSELRSLAVENTGAAAGDGYVAAVLARDCELHMTQVTAEAVGSKQNAGILVHWTTSGGDTVLVTGGQAWAGRGVANTGIMIYSDIAAGLPLPVAAIIKDAAVGADNNGISVIRAQPVISGGVAFGEEGCAVKVFGGSPVIIGTALAGDIQVEGNSGEAVPMKMSNCIAGSWAGTVLGIDDGALLVTNSHLERAVSMTNGSKLTLLNSSVGQATMDGGQLTAANSSFAGAVSVSGGGVARCEFSTKLGAVFAPLDMNCQ